VTEEIFPASKKTILNLPFWSNRWQIASKQA
jgi:hypothetical protein